MGRLKWDRNIVPYIDQIPKWRRQGLTEEQIARRLNVAYSTFREYKEGTNVAANRRGIDTSALYAALKEGTEKLIVDLEETLYQKAMGGRKVTKTKTIYKTIHGKQVIDKKEVQQDELAPDTGALIFALKNLDPDKWKDRREVNNSFGEDDKITIINTLPKHIGKNDE